MVRHSDWKFGRWYRGLLKGHPIFFGLGPVSIKIGKRGEDHPMWTALKSTAGQEGAAK
jgi:hypothetical protein